MAPPNDGWAKIRRELLAMAEHDRAVREELATDGSLFEGYHPRMREVHDDHAARLTEIMAAHGWPGESQVGRDGAEAAWLVAQHAIAQPRFQRAALRLLQAAADRGEVPPVQPAMLEDRIRAFEGRSQRYGTQFDWDSEGRMSPLPIEDPAGVDERRRAIGLGPLDAAIAAQRQAVASSAERPPADWSPRVREYEAWLREVGWRS